MGDARRRRAAEAADPIAAAAVRLDDACRDLAWATARAGVPPAALVDVLYRNLVITLASILPAASGDDTATRFTASLVGDVADARGRAEAAVRAPPRPPGDTVQ